MNRERSLKVCLGDRAVGTLAVTPQRLVAFEYDPAWLADGFSVSPFSLPLRSGVFLPKSYDPFEGLFGVFADSLPDGWGRLLVDRMLAREGIDPAAVDSLTRLSIVGRSGRGALTYHPEQGLEVGLSGLTMDQLAAECARMFDTEQSDSLDELFQKGGSSGGARPKIFYRMDDADWIVKFPCSLDAEDIGEQEYRYMYCAGKCGIEVPEVRLLPSNRCAGYFATKCFDRRGDGRLHMVSAAGLLETSHRIPNLDYHTLMQLTMRLTRSYEEIEKLYRLMCFNVFAHNRDDHSKNFSFLCEAGQWRLSPAYDLTYSDSIGGEHATTVNGNGVNPGMDDLLAVVRKIRFDETKARKIAQEIREIVAEELKS